MRLKNLILGLVLGTALAAGFWLSTQRAVPVPTPVRATVLPTALAIPDFSLIDDTGKNIGAAFFQGQWDLVFFGFTNCPDICPLTLQTLRSAKKQLQASGHKPLPRIVLISVDPERDTPAILAQYIDHFGEGNAGITGELLELRKLTDTLGVFFEKREGETENYNVDHTSVVFLIDPAARYVALFSSPHEIENFVHDLPILMSSPLTASEVEVTAPIPGSSMSAAYLNLKNNGRHEVRVTHVSSPQYGSVEMHETIIDDGVARMRPIPELVLGAGANATFERRAKHLMLMNRTEQAGPVTLNLFSDKVLLLSLTDDASDSPK